uniref:Glycoprotein 120 n=1 Tax=Anisakis simplex TaxID=6269 RepID=A0A0M3JKP3_ANISI
LMHHGEENHGMVVMGPAIRIRIQFVCCFI